MSRRDRIKDRFPLFYAYGSRHTFLDAQAAIEADAPTRIRSIWPFIVRRVLAFQQTLKSRERVNFDPEDTLSELWIALVENDAEWSPERGKYITFAGVIIDRELCAIRDKARTVESPRNSSCRLKEYRSEEEAGTITDRRRKTAADIRRTAEGIQPILTSPGERSEVGAALDGEPVSVLTEQEETAETLDAVKAALRTLPAFEATVIGRLSGLWGREPESVWQIAWETGRDETEIRRAKIRAREMIRHHLLSISHPAVLAVVD